jgi:type I restriction enzyme S subunit
MRDGWIETSLEEIAEVIMGQSPDGKTYNQSGDGLPFMQGSAEFGEHHPTPEKWCSDPKKIAEPGDLLLSVRAPVGDTNFADQRIAVGRGLSVIRANSNSVTEFIRYVIQLNVAEMIASSGTGMFASITGKNLKEFKVLLPPIPEQKRIVDLISSVDSYIEALQQQLESVKRSRNALLHALLTAGGDDWEATTIGDISNFISVRKSPEQLSSDSIYVGLEHLEPNNTSIDKFDSIRKVTSSLTPFDVGDVLFGRLRPYLHKVAIAEMFGFCSPEILVLRANAKVLPQMLLLYCDADSTIKICVERSAGTRMPRTSTDDLASIEIKLPLMAEQIKLAELFNTFDTDISKIVIALEKSKMLRSGLLSDLLSGEHEIPASYDKVLGAA